MAQNRILAKLASWFFLDGTETSVRGNFTRLKEGHDPSENTHRSMLENSVAMFAEEESRAKQTTGAGLQVEQGLVTVASNVQAKALATQLADRTIVIQPDQLPETIAGAAQVISGNFVANFNDLVFAIADNASQASRNVYAVSLSANFITFLGTITQEVDALRNSIGNNVDDGDLGAFAAPGTVILTEADDSARDALQRIADYVGDLGTGYTYITDNVPLVQGLIDIEAAIAAIVPGSGEANTASSIGGNEEIFFQKSGVDLEFRTLKSLIAYIDINVGTEVVSGDILTFNFNTASFISNEITPLLTPYLLSSSQRTVVTHPSATGVSGVDVISGNNEQVLGYLNGAGILPISIVGKDLVFAIDESYINTLINAQMISEQGDAKSYLFSADVNAEQPLNLGSKIIFADDFSDGKYDYNNTWTNGQWVANAEAGADGDVEFDANFTIEVKTGETTPAGQNIDVTIYKWTSSEITVTTIPAIDVSNLVATNQKTIYFNSQSISVADGDRVYIKISGENTLGLVEKFKVVAGSIYNTEV